ncbi:sericin-1-like [Oncorhynchus masou masou]|uniref:sericin-1-like n=1 Tax=Oncorhynchus masou masou TaxID=90313 RepID=UPI00318301A0
MATLLNGQRGGSSGQRGGSSGQRGGSSGQRGALGWGGVLVPLGTERAGETPAAVPDRRELRQQRRTGETPAAARTGDSGSSAGQGRLPAAPDSGDSGSSGRRKALPDSG